MRDQTQQEVIKTRSDLKAAAAVREQLEERLRAMPTSPARAARTMGSQAKRPRKSKRAVK
jgi:hypothetical protein